MRSATVRDRDPFWYKDAIFYELRVRSFYDSNGDGIGDFPGVTAKLDYLRDLGITTIWLLPFYPSPMRDDGYDIADYCSVHPDCGTLDDFVAFLEQAHRRSLRVVTELVLNHTSDQHPWFQRARRAPPDSPERNFYVWSETPERYREARIIFKDFELSNWTWDPVARAYFWHRFYSHQPDLNFDNPAVHKAVFDVVDFWMGLGVDGLRLDAVPYLYEREGTNCENLPETYEFLRSLRRHIDEHHENRMLLAEANQWPEDAVAYFDGGKSCHMAFHFPIMPRMFMSVRAEDRFPITDMWSQTPGIAEACQWALFLRNHDELTLEMVTEEEREYMYRAYARERRMRINLGIRRRLAPLLGNDRRTVELMNGLLFSLPGTPVVYYGDEIGMGDNVFLGDRDGVRTPMQWSGDRNAGFSRANPQRLLLPVVIDHEYHYQTVNVEAQEQNRHSLLWWMRRLVALRKQFRAFGRGSIELLQPENAKVLAFIRAYDSERILVVANLSRFPQYVELDLARWKGAVPIELTGRTEFPVITESPYSLTLGPHMFLWFELSPLLATQAREAHRPPRLELEAGFEELGRIELRPMLEGVVTRYLAHRALADRTSRRPHVARVPKHARFADWIPLARPNLTPGLSLIECEYEHGEPDTHVLALHAVTGEAAATVREKSPERIVAELAIGSADGGPPQSGVLFDAACTPDIGRALLLVLDGDARVHADAGGQLVASKAPGYDQLRGAPDPQLEPRVVRNEQINTSIVLGDRLIIKVYRQLEDGVNPDLEMGRELTERGFAFTPKVAGAVEYQRRGVDNRTVAVAHAFVQNEGDGLHYAREELRRYFERAATRRDLIQRPQRRLLDLPTGEPIPQFVTDMIGAYLDVARLLGCHVADLHSLLANTDKPEFAPERYSYLYQRSVYQSMRNVAARVSRGLAARMSLLGPSVRLLAEQLLARRNEIDAVFDAFYRRRVTVVRTRLHGNLHLGNWLYTGRDFLIIDFEGEKNRPISDRAHKRSSLRDVASMLRSFHRSAFEVLHELTGTGGLGESSFESMEPSARFWYTWCSWAFLDAYLAQSGGGPFVPRAADELRLLLDAFMLEGALREVGQRLQGAPNSERIALDAAHQILDDRCPEEGLPEHAGKEQS